MSKMFDSSKDLRILFSLKNTHKNRQNLGDAIRFVVSSSINGSNEMPGYESSSLIHFYSIKNGMAK